MRAFWAAVLLCVAAATAAPAQAELEAITQARHDLKLAFTVPGIVQKLYVEPGDRVKAGDLLMELEDAEGKALIDIYQRRADSELSVDAAKAQMELAKVEYKALKQAFDHGAGTPIEVERAEVRVQVADLEWQLAKLQLDEAKSQLDQAVSRHDKYLLRAPVDGFVDQIVISEGESVEQLKPVLRLVVVDPLRLDAAVPTVETLKLKVGDPVWVTLKLPSYPEPLQGQIIHLAQIADGASETRLVRVEFANHSNLPAGVHVRVSFTPPAGLAKADAADGVAQAQVENDTP